MYKVGVVPIVGQIAIISGTYSIPLKLHSESTAVKSIVTLSFGFLSVAVGMDYI